MTNFDWFLLGAVLILILPLWMILDTRSWHRQRQKQTEAKGWRYGKGERFNLKSKKFNIAGTSSKGITWELMHVQRGTQHMLSWSTNQVPLPFGTVTILPASDGKSSKTGLHPLLNDERIPPRIAVYLTHDHLFERFWSDEVAVCLQEMPAFPTLGSLTEIAWGKHGLIINCRYGHQWHDITRTIRLGETLTNSFINNKRL